jgi:hypothetical protein
MHTPNKNLIAFCFDMISIPQRKAIKRIIIYSGASFSVNLPVLFHYKVATDRA